MSGKGKTKRGRKSKKEIIIEVNDDTLSSAGDDIDIEEENPQENIDVEDEDKGTTVSRSRAPLSHREMKKLVRELKRDLKNIKKTLNKRDNQKYFEEELRNKEMYDDMISQLTRLEKKYQTVIAKKRAVRYVYLTDKAVNYINNNPVDDNQPEIGNILPHGTLTRWMYRLYKHVGVKIDKEATGSVMNRRYIKADKDLISVIGWEERRIYYSQTQKVISSMVHKGVTPSQGEIDQEKEKIDAFIKFVASI